MGDVVADPLRPVPEAPDVYHYRAGLEKALQIDTEGCTFDVVIERLQTGHAKFWPISTESAMITQISGLSLHFWLASGKLADLQTATPHILDYGREHGCTRATLTGRRGWLRSFLKDTGWRQSNVIQMEVEL